MEQEATVFFDQMIHIAIILVTMVVALIAVRLFLRHVEKLQMHHLSKGRVKTLNGILYGMARAIIIFIALTLVLDRFGINTSSVIAAAGIGGIAIAFGAQAIIADIFSGFFLLMDGQMEVGDWVVLDGG